MEISVYRKVKAACLGSSQSLCCNCRKETPGKPRSRDTGCTEDSKHSRCFIRCCLESRNNGPKTGMLMSPLSQLSTNIFFIFGGFGCLKRRLQEALNASVIAFRILTLKAWCLGVSWTWNLFFFFFKGSRLIAIASTVIALSLSLMTCSLFTSKDAGNERNKYK